VAPQSRRALIGGGWRNGLADRPPSPLGSPRFEPTTHSGRRCTTELGLRQDKNVSSQSDPSVAHAV